MTATTITGSPPATSTTITALTNGTSYTFKVTATNAIGTGPPSAASNAVTPSAAWVTPAFVQQVSSHASGVTSRVVTPSSRITAGNRLVVLVGVWGSSGATAKSVTDSAGDTYTKVLHFEASDQTELRRACGLPRSPAVARLNQRSPLLPPPLASAGRTSGADKRQQSGEWELGSSGRRVARAAKTAFAPIVIFAGAPPARRSAQKR
jgi:hypothetical protein